MWSSVAVQPASRLGRRGEEPVPGYRLLERVGRGGSGEVWRADAPGGLPVALKLIRTDGNLGSRELNSLQVLRAIRHPNLLAYFGAWVMGDLLVLGMELADRSLWDRWSECHARGLAGLPRGELLQAMSEAARVIDFLHQPVHRLEGMTGVAIHHRDIKPQNLMLQGGGLKVADFGLSCLVHQGATRLSQLGMTYPYAAPETFRGEFTDQSDQYSLAVSYCLLRGGRLPFAGPPAVVMVGHLLQPPDLSMLPEPERPILLRALAKQPADRWPDCRRFVAELAGCPAAESPETMPFAAEDQDEEVLAPSRSAFPDWGEGPEVPTGLLDESWYGELESSDAAPAPPDGRSVPGDGAPTFLDVGTTASGPEPPARTRPAIVASRVAACLLVTGVCVWSMTQVGARESSRALRTDRIAPIAPIDDHAAGKGPTTLASHPPDSSGIGSKDAGNERSTGPVGPARAAAEAPALVGPIGSTSEGAGTAAAPVRELSPPGLVAKTQGVGAPARPAIAAGVDALRLQAGRIVRMEHQAVGASGAGRTVQAAPTPGAMPPGRSDQGQERASLRIGLPDFVEIDAGWSKTVPVAVSRGDTAGPVTVRFEGLPSGVSLPPLTLPARAAQGGACVRAALGAASSRSRVRMIASRGKDLAEASLSLVVRANPALVHRAQGHAMLANGKPSEAISAFSRALALSPPDPAALNNRGLAFTMTSRPQAAIADYTAALKLSPRDPAIRCNRAAAYARCGETMRARLDLDTVIRIAPRYIPAYRSRAALHLRMGDPAKAWVDRTTADRLELESRAAVARPATAGSPGGSSPAAACDRSPTTLDRLQGM